MGGKELGFPRVEKPNLREQAARTVLRNVRAQGHPYVDLREDKKKFIYFCTLCLAPCYSDTVLFDHLRGNLHNERLTAAKLTLLRPNPWPFNDGVFFFDNSAEDNKLLKINEDSPRPVEFQSSDSLAIVKYGEENREISHGHDDASDAALNNDDESCNFLIPNVLVKAELSDLMVRFVGVGKIGARYLDKDDSLHSYVRIWCEWLGKHSHDDDSDVPKHDFAIISLPYSYEIGRKGLFDDITSLLTSSPNHDPENADNEDKKRKKCFSDPEDVIESPNRQYDSSGEESAASCVSTSRVMLDRCDDQMLCSRIISSKTARRELRQLQRLAAERLCGICQQKMLPGKDVATLMNLKMGKLACSSRNPNGAFHVYHASCLIHWVLLCEFEIARASQSAPQTKGRSRKKNTAKSNKLKRDCEQVPPLRKFDSVFCPECQGTGICAEGDVLEREKVSLTEMYNFKLKVIDARKAWMKSPEGLENCSIGFHFPRESEEKIPEKVSPLKLLNFYAAVDSGRP